MSVTIALAKGRLGGEALDMLAAGGFNCEEARDPGRKLVTEEVGGVRFMLVKPADVPAYVDYGVADVGIAGKDTLMEENRRLCEIADLGFGRCRLCVAGNPVAYGKAIGTASLRIATKYPRIAAAYFEERGQPLTIIKLSGSIELAPLVGLSDAIVDIVESGDTLRANGLDVIEEICRVSARLVVNPISLKTKTAEIKRIEAALSRRMN